MTVVIKSNVIASANLGGIATVTQSASDIYTAYAARVAADGGTMQDATACQAAITAAINGSYFYKAAYAISARWGIKVSGGNISKFYNLVDSAFDAVVTGTLPLDTTHAAWATALFTTQSATFTALNLNKTGIMGRVTATVDHGSTINGLQIVTTPVSEVWRWDDGGSVDLSINAVTKVAASPDFAFSANASVGVLLEQASGRFSLLVDGILRKQVTASLTTLAANITATAVLQRNSGNVYMSEDWYFNAATYDTLAACCFDVGGRY